MNQMGWTFRAPKKSNVRQWRKIKLLFKSGETFNRREKNLPVPKNLSEVKPYLLDKKNL